MISKLFTSITIFILLAVVTTESFEQTKDTSSYKAGKVFKDCKNCPEMVVIPAGNYMMGAAEKEPGSYPEEKPQRKVSVEKFAAGRFDITKAQWALFVKETNRPATGGCSWAALPGDTGKPWNGNPAANWNHIGFVKFQ